MTAECWRRVNAELVAKAVGECAYEECLRPAPDGDGFRLDLSSGTTYRFRARRTPWTWLRVDPGSVARDGKPVESAVQFFLDARAELCIDDIALGVLTQELQNTLYSEARRQERLVGIPARDMVALPGPRLQSLLDGHPKLLANKGRLGWGAEELEAYAPESGNPFRLRFVAVRRGHCTVAEREGTGQSDRLDACLDADARTELERRMAARGVDPETFVVLPVHPWQWQHCIRTQYAESLARGDLIDLGVLGDEYLPQQSIRTLSNVSRPGRSDVKTSLTILNTSCYRGVPGEHIAAGVQVSRWLEGVTATDPELRDRGLTVLAETAGIHCPHPRQSQVPGTPYRYNEMLGAVWRDSIESHLKAGEQGILLSTLMQTDLDGRPLVAEYVERSGLGVEAWLRALFEATAVPLYHLLCRYGVGLVAHGQNVSLILHGGRPVRGVIKDFHGDLRLVDREFPEQASLDPVAASALKRLPPEHLLHDLVTGHMVTTLRFISPHFEEHLGLPETRFYAVLSETLRDLVAAHPELEPRFRMFPLLTPTLHRVCVNRVRFRIGYGDSAERPLPELGTPLPNPLNPPIPEILQ